MTIDTYSYTLPSLQAEAISQLNALLQVPTEEGKPVAVNVAVKPEPVKKTKKMNPG